MKFKKSISLFLCFSFLFLSGCSGEEKKQYHIYFDTQTRDGIISSLVDEGSKIMQPSISKEGYDLIGWSRNGETISIDDITVTEDMTLTAQWKIATYDVHFEMVDNTQELKDFFINIDYPGKASFNDIISPSFDITDERWDMDYKCIWSIDHQIVSTERTFEYKMPSHDIILSLIVCKYFNTNIYTNNITYKYSEEKKAFEAEVKNAFGINEYPSYYGGIPIYKYTFNSTIFSSNPNIHPYADLIFPDGIEEIQFNETEKNIRSLSLGKDVRFFAGSEGTPVFLGEHLDRVKVSKENPYFSDGDDNLLMNKEETFLYFAGNRFTHIPSTIKKIGRYAFRSCKDRQDIIIPEGVNEIDSIFVGSRLNSITLPNTVFKIDEDDFFDTSINHIYCENNPYYYTDKDNNFLIERYSSTLLYTADITKQIPDNINNIGRTAFSTTMESKADRITIPDNILEFRARYFNSEELYIGSNVKNIVFLDSLAKTNVIVSENNKTYSSIDGNLLDKKQDALLVVGKNKTLSDKIKRVLSFNNSDYVKTWGSHFQSDGHTYEEIRLPQYIEEYLSPNLILINYSRRLIINKSARFLASNTLNNGSPKVAIFIPKNVQTIEKNVIYNSIDPQLFEGLSIYCEAKEKPSGWDENWYKDAYNPNLYKKIDIHWGVTLEEYYNFESETKN